MGMKFSLNLKSYWTNIGLNNTAFRKTRILLPSSSEYKYSGYWGEGAYKTSLLPTEAEKDSWIKEMVQFCKILSFELTWGESLVSFSDPILSGVYLSVFLYNFLIFDFFRTNFNKFLHKARN